MAIHFEKKEEQMHVECDLCKEVGDTRGLDWKECWANMKAFGWRSYKAGDTWYNSCPNCSKGHRP